MDWITLGYWHDDDWGEGKRGFMPLLVHAQALVEPNWEPERRAAITEYLRNGYPVTRCFGYSYCRFGCKDVNMGSHDHSDGVWVWPEGLAHYVEVHNVKLPDEFVARVFSPVSPRHEPAEADRWLTDFWREWCQKQIRELKAEPLCRACQMEVERRSEKPAGLPAGEPRVIDVTPTGRAPAPSLSIVGKLRKALKRWPLG